MTTSSKFYHTSSDCATSETGTQQKYSVSTNVHHHDKEVANSRYYRDGFESRPLTIEQLAGAVKRGRAWSCATYRDSKRSKSNFIEGQLIGIDIDSDLPLSAALENSFVKKHCLLLYTSASHQKAKGDKPPCDRYRLVFGLSDPLSNIGEFEAAIALVIKEFPQADQGCKDSSRYWAGNSNAEVYFLEGGLLGRDFIDTVKKQSQKEAIARENQRLESRKNLERYRSNFSGSDDLEIARTCLSYIDLSSMAWHEYRDFLFACNHVGLDESEVYRCSVASPKHTDKGFYAIWKGIKGNTPKPIGLGTLIYLAKQNGWIPPKGSDRDWIDPREPDQAAYSAYLESEKESDRLDSAIESENKITRFIDKLKKFARIKPKGFGKQKAVATPESEKKATSAIDYVRGELPYPDVWEALGRPEVFFEKEDRNAWLAEGSGKGYAVHDASIMGSGKSHAVPMIGNEDDRVLYLNNEHRDPPIRQIKEQFTDLDPRTKHGFFLDGEKIKVADRDTPEAAIIKKGNCPTNADKFHALAKKGYNPNARSEVAEDGKSVVNPICAACTFHKMKVKGEREIIDENGVATTIETTSSHCAATKGFYLHDRHEAFKSKRLRASIESLTRGGDYSKDRIVIDEAGREIKPTKTIHTNENELRIECDRARDLIDDSDDFTLEEKTAIKTYLDPLKRETIAKIAEGSKMRHGLEHDQIVLNLPLLEGDLHKAFIVFLEDSEEELIKAAISEPDRVYKTDGVSHFAQKRANQHLWSENEAKVTEAIQNLPHNALINILKSLYNRTNADSPYQNVVLRCQSGRLILTVVDRWQGEILNNCKGATFLDATTDSAWLKTLTGIETPILTGREKILKPLANYTAYVIETPGLKTNSFTKAAIKRIKALTGALTSQHGEMPMITHKAMREDLGGNGHWFLDNRSSNQFEGVKNMIFVGTPYPNVGAIKDEYFALTGSLDGFEEHYASKVEAEQLQAIGRQRCQRSPDEKFQGFFIGTDQDLSMLEEHGAKVVKMNAFEITPEAGDAWRYALWQVIETLQVTGELSLREISRRLGKSPSAVSKLLREHGINTKELFLKLKVTTDSIKSSIESVSTHQEILKDGYYRTLLQLSPLELAEEIVTAIADMGWQEFKDTILPIFPPPLQVKILSVLTGLMIFESDAAIFESG